jgi:hypothetical protein
MPTHIKSLRLALGCLILGCCASLTTLHAVGNDPWVIAQNFDLVGKGQPSSCVPFAFDLTSRFLFTRTEATIVIFDWKLESGGAGRHAMVVFRDARKRLWAMDNLRDKPLWIRGERPEEWIAQFMPKARTRLVSTLPNLYATQELALGNPNPDPKAYQDAASLPRQEKE